MLIFFNKVIIRIKNIILYKLRKVRRFILNVKINNFPKLLRISSKPYISGDSFRKISNHIFDETQSFNPNNVNYGEVIFVKGDLLQLFFETLHPSIKNKYILISHNSDFEINESIIKYVDNKIIKYFAQNLNIPANEHITVLPIGLENRYYLNNGKLAHFKKNLNSKKNLPILASFSNSNSERSEILKLIEVNSLIIHEKFKNHKEYVKSMKKFKFNICPPGNGLDTHRVWESLLLDTYPIFVRNTFTMNFEKLGLPALYLDNWSELNNLNQNILENCYKELKFKSLNKKFVNLKYWTNEIKDSAV